MLYISAKYLIAFEKRLYSNPKSPVLMSNQVFSGTFTHFLELQRYRTFLDPSVHYIMNLKWSAHSPIYAIVEPVPIPELTIFDSYGVGGPRKNDTLQLVSFENELNNSWPIILVSKPLVFRS